MRIMKKNLFLTALAIVAFASCTSDDFVGDVTNPQDNSPSASEAIVFSSASKGITRADIVGADAAVLLGNNFVVYGAKSTSTTTASNFAGTKVFDHYNVNFINNSAGTTASNTSDWEYVGQTKHAHAATTDQTIKYWDLSTAEYDFLAYSTGTATELSSGDATSGKLVVSAINPATATTSAYTVTGTSADDLQKFYIADIVPVLKADYKKEVVFNFRSLTSKVRIGLYETVPGYSVKDVKFYSAESTVGDGTPYLYGGATAFNDKGTYTVSYPTIGYENKDNSDYNKAHVGFTPASSEGQSGLKTFEALTPKVGLTDDNASGDYLGRTAPKASLSPYLTVLPNETGVILNMKCDYTLEAIDGSGETMKVTGASAQVPSVYAKWLPNYAYTYIFKISDKSNGSTGTPGTDDAGLYPITFDATVIDSEANKQETITIVETPSITTYQKGSQGNNEYVAGTIYVMVQNGESLVNDLDSKGQLYTVNITGMNSNTVLSETAVSEALNIGATTSGTTTTGRNGIALTKAESNTAITTIIGPDGNNITVDAKTAASFSATSGTTYAYVYTVSDADDTFLTTAVTVAADAVSDATGYYTDMACTTAATLTGGKLPAGTYYQKVTNNNTTYAVKIIKVQ